jgi:DNA polymerase
MDAGQAASALLWWQEAGVDVLVADTPRDWLKPAPTPAPPALAAAEPAPVERLPDTLDAFHAWLAAAALPFATPNAARLMPAGDPFSGLMVMTDMPAPAGTWFEGEADPLFDRMMSAIGRSRDSLYLAPLSPMRTTQMRLDPASEHRLVEIARHHIGLVRPRALLLFGEMGTQALLGEAVAHARGRWHDLETPTGPVRTLATIRPERVVRQPNHRKHVWDDLQMLREELDR